MPAKVKIKILSCKNLPVMDRANATTDAFVEVKLGNITYKTDVKRKSLNPVFNSQWFRYEIDDQEIQDEVLQIRVMDYDTYSANDAIGKVCLSLNPLLLQNDSNGSKGFSGYIPIYDTMNGIRGEINFIVKVELFSDSNKFRQSSCGVQFFHTSSIPFGYHAVIRGFVEEMIVDDDPEHDWIDKIRRASASNEARQQTFMRLAGQIQRKIGLKVLNLGGNAVIGFQQRFDLEKDTIIARGIGTCVLLVKIQSEQLNTSGVPNIPEDEKISKFSSSKSSFAKLETIFDEQYSRKTSLEAEQWIPQSKLSVPSISVDNVDGTSIVSTISTNYDSTSLNDDKRSELDTVSMIVRNVEAFAMQELEAQKVSPRTKHEFLNELKEKFHHLGSKKNKEGTHDVTKKKEILHDLKENVNHKFHQIAEKIHHIHLPHLHHETDESLVSQAMQTILLEKFNIVEASSGIHPSSSSEESGGAKRKNSNTNFHVIVLSETHLRTDDIPYFNIPGYKAEHSIRLGNGWGGVSIYVRRDYSDFNVIHSIEFDLNNSILIELTRYPFKILGFYKFQNCSDQNFLRHVEQVLVDHQNCICVGDFNINLFNINSDILARKYYDLVISSGFIFLNDLSASTRTCRRADGSESNTLIDHIFSDIPFTKPNYDFHFYLDTLMGDHKAFLFSIDLKNDFTHSAKKFIKITKTKHDVIKSNKLIENIQADNFGDFQLKLKTIFDKNTTCVLKKDRFRKPFMNNEILTLMVIRQNYYHLKKRFPWSNKMIEKFRFYRNLVNSKCADAKRDFFNLKFQRDSNDPKQFWNHVNNLIYNRDKKPHNTCQALKINNTNVTNKIAICEHFNAHFTSVAERIKRSISTNTFHFNLIHDAEEYIIRYPLNLELLKSTEDDFLVILSRLSNSNALDYFGFSNNTLKCHKDALAKPLSELTNDCIINGFFHPSLKIAKVNPLYKNSGTNKEVNNYRPLSITPIVSKCIEDFLLGILSTYLFKNEIIHKSQFGFTKGSSTEVATVHVLNEVYNNKSKSLSTAILFIDLQKAFDSVTHEILINKLRKIKLSNNLITLFKSYFVDRYQYVQIEDSKSPHMSINAGVFQGSKLASLLFILYINNIFSLPLNGKMFLYADDIAIVYGAKNVSELKTQMENDLILLNCWLENHYLLLNLSKTKYVFFQSRAYFDYFIPGSLNLLFKGATINRVSSYDYLGIIIDERLNFEEHINSISSRILSTIFAIKRIRSFISVNTARQLYFQHIHSLLIYLNSCWNVAGSTRIETLAVLQRKALRIIYLKDIYFPTKQLFTHQILPLLHLNTYQILILTFKMINKLHRSNVLVPLRGEISGRANNVEKAFTLDHEENLSIDELKIHEDTLSEASIESTITVLPSSERLSLKAISKEDLKLSVQNFDLILKTNSHGATFADTNKPLHESLLSLSRNELLSASPNIKTHARTESIGCKMMGGSPSKQQQQQQCGSLPIKDASSNICRRSSDSDLSITPKGNSLTPANFERSAMKVPSAVLKPNQDNSLDTVLEYPFLTLTKYPPGFIIHIGATVSARSVKLLDKSTANPEDMETRDSWFNELRMEIRGHAKSLGCNVVLGYTETASINDDVSVLSASGTAAVINLNYNSHEDSELKITKTGASINPRELLLTTSVEETIQILEENAQKIAISSENGNSNVENEKTNGEDANNDVFNTSGNTNNSSGSNGISQSYCNLYHIPYSRSSIQIGGASIGKCCLCKRGYVPDVILATIELPELDGLSVIGIGTLIQATVCRPKRDLRSESNAKEISDALPFLEYELHRLLINKLKVKGMNAIFRLSIQVSIGDKIMSLIATGTAVYLAALHPPVVPKIVAGNSFSESSDKLAELQKTIQNTVEKNRERYQLTNQLELTTDQVQKLNKNFSDTEDSDNEEKLDYAIGNKQTCILEIDDIQDLELYSMLTEQYVPEGINIVNAQNLPGQHQNIENMRNVQTFVQVWRTKLVSSHQSNSNFSRHFQRLLQSIFFKLRFAVPCHICNLQFQLDLPTDEIQLLITGIVLKAAANKSKSSKIVHSISHDKKFEDELMFSLEEEETEITAASQAVGKDKAGKKGQQFNNLAKITSRNDKFVDISPLSFVPGAKVEKYLGNLSFCFIRETQNVRDYGGICGFVHSFISELLAIMRAHISALGGNMMLAFYMTELILSDNPHKNQAQLLINSGGDAVYCTYPTDDN